MKNTKKKVYQYTKEGKFLKQWDCKRELVLHYFPQYNGNHPVLRNNDVEYLKQDNTVIAITRIGRDRVLEFVKRKLNPYVNRPKGGGEISDKGVEVLNMDNEVIATFKDYDIAYKMLNIPKGTLFNRLQKAKRFGKDGLLFKLKD